MKKLFKKLSFGIFRLLTKVKTSFFSNSFISSGYAIKSEHFYNTCGAKEYTLDRYHLHEELASKFLSPKDEILFLEFGVMRGKTFLIWSKNNHNPDSRLVGFDTFTGLPEDWGNVKKGTFSAEGQLPEVNDERAAFCVGLIQDTLPGYIRQIDKRKKKIIHIDVDLYNASLITLIHLQPLLQNGDVIIFDDFFTLTKGDHEFRAFMDFLSLYKISYKPLYKHRDGHFVIQII